VLLRLLVIIQTSLSKSFVSRTVMRWFSFFTVWKRVHARPSWKYRMVLSTGLHIMVNMQVTRSSHLKRIGNVTLGLLTRGYACARVVLIQTQSAAEAFPTS
jgi:hypothetical protein